MATEIDVQYVENWDDLYCHYPQQTDGQPCYIELDCRTGILTASYNAEIGNAVPCSVYHGHARRYSIPCLTADAANELLDEIFPLAQRVLDGYESHWNGQNMIAVLSGDAAAAEGEIELLLEGTFVDETNGISGVDASDWLVDGCPDGLTPDTTDEELSSMADSFNDEAAADNMVLRGAVEYLEVLRQQLRDAVDDE